MTHASEHRIRVGEVIYRVLIAADGTVTIEGRPGSVSVDRLDATTFHAHLDGRRVLVYLAVQDEQCWAFSDGWSMVLDLAPDDGAARQPAAPDHSLAAPMPATVLSVLVEPGQSVRSGDPVVILEAMKMELTIRAPHDGTIGTVRCAVGDLVQPGLPLVEMV